MVLKVTQVNDIQNDKRKAKSLQLPNPNSKARKKKIYFFLPKWINQVKANKGLEETFFNLCDAQRPSQNGGHCIYLFQFNASWRVFCFVFKEAYINFIKYGALLALL